MDALSDLVEWGPLSLDAQRIALDGGVDEQALSALVSNPYVDWEVALKVARRSPDAYYEVQHREDLPVEIQVALLTFGRGEETFPLVSNPCLAPHLQEGLARSAPVRVQAALAHNPSLTTVALGILRESNSLLVLSALALSPLTPVDLLEELFEEVEVHDSLAWNTALPAHLQEGLAASPNAFVRDRLAGNRSLVPHLQAAFAKDPKMVAAVAANRSLSPDLQETLARSELRLVRVGIASHTALPHLQIVLSADDDEAVRRVLGTNPRLVRSTDLSARFLWEHQKGWLTELGDEASLAEGWRGSLRDLHEAVRLIQGQGATS